MTTDLWLSQSVIIKAGVVVNESAIVCGHSQHWVHRCFFSALRLKLIHLLMCLKTNKTKQNTLVFEGMGSLTPVTVTTTVNGLCCYLCIWTQPLPHSWLVLYTPPTPSALQWEPGQSWRSEHRSCVTTAGKPTHSISVSLLLLQSDNSQSMYSCFRCSQMIISLCLRFLSQSEICSDLVRARLTVTTVTTTTTVTSTVFCRQQLAYI